MESTAILVVVLLVLAGVAYFVVKSALKWAVRLLLLGVLAVLLLAGGIAWWWYTPGDTEAPERRPSNANATGGPARKR
jgi:protein-S-isoprenylcysteine O-methyltransferase Ste14